MAKSKAPWGRKKNGAAKKKPGRKRGHKTKRGKR